MPKHTLLNALRDEKELSSRGICIIVWKVVPFYHPHRAEVSQLLDNLFLRWPEFSGNVEYPVPHPTLAAEDAYTMGAFGLNDVSMWHGEYGESRRRLLAWMIEDLQKS